MANAGRKLNDGLPLGEGYFGYLAGVLEHSVEARNVVGELVARREKGYGPALPVAWTYLGLGETSAALAKIQATCKPTQTLGLVEIPVSEQRP